MPSLEGKKMFLYLAPKKAGSQKKSQQARDREAAKAEDTGKKAVETATEVDVETPANGGLLANAKKVRNARYMRCHHIINNNLKLKKNAKSKDKFRREEEIHVHRYR